MLFGGYRSVFEGLVLSASQCKVSGAWLKSPEASNSDRDVHQVINGLVASC
jgi:hypothetical protein